MSVDDQGGGSGVDKTGDNPLAKAEDGGDEEGGVMSTRTESPLISRKMTQTKSNHLPWQRGQGTMVIRPGS